MHRCLLLAPLAFFALASMSLAADFPPPSQLPFQPQLPDPLKQMDGDVVDTIEKWQSKRVPELRDLFEHYMYGVIPPGPKEPRFALVREDPLCFGGKATLRETTIILGPPGAPDMHVLEVRPNNKEHPVPVFVGLNFGGIHTLLDDPKITLTPRWIPARLAGPTEKASDEKRGSAKEQWSLEQTIDRGYAVVTCYAGDIDPDKPDPTDGIEPFFTSADGDDHWGTIAMWAWGMMRLVDYVQTRQPLDDSKIIAFGHSRMGKTALVAAAFDPRIDIAIPHQAGCGGTSPSRGIVGESVAKINTSFPHWFCRRFKLFNNAVDRLPFDQHELIALCAPRPVLLSNAVEDQWANPDGQFEMLVAASPVYKLFGEEVTTMKDKPPVGTLLPKKLGYYIREGKHSTTPGDWKIFCDYADAQLKKAK